MYEQFTQSQEIYFGPLEFRKYEKIGFASPSGKVDLKPSVLEGLGFDPLPSR